MQNRRFCRYRFILGGILLLWGLGRMSLGTSSAPSGPMENTPQKNNGLMANPSYHSPANTPPRQSAPLPADQTKQASSLSNDSKTASKSPSPVHPDSESQTSSVKNPAADRTTTGANQTLDIEKQVVGKPRTSNSSPETASTHKNTGLGSTSAWRPWLSLLVVLGLIGLCALLFRRLAFGGRAAHATPAVEILARSTVTPKHSVCLVKLGQRLLLVGISPNHMSSLLALDDPDEITHVMGQLEKRSPRSISNTFDRLFHRESGRYDFDENDLEPHDGEDTQVYDYDRENPPQWNFARRELSSLLSKVKGLTRLRPH